MGVPPSLAKTALKVVGVRESHSQLFIMNAVHCGASLSYIIGYIMVNTGYMRARV